MIRSKFARSIIVAFLVVGVSAGAVLVPPPGSLAQSTDTPTPRPPTSTSEPTSTQYPWEVPPSALPICSMTPSGSETPTPTPLVPTVLIPTYEIPTYQVVSVTATSVPTGEVYFVGVSQVEETECVKGGDWSARCYFPVSHEFYTDTEVVAVVIEMCKESSGCGEINAWAVDSCGASGRYWQSGVYDHSYQSQCAGGFTTRCIGDEDACDELFPGDNWSPDPPYGTFTTGQQRCIAWWASNNQCDYFRVRNVRLIYYGDYSPVPTVTPTPYVTPTATVTPTDYPCVTPTGPITETPPIAGFNPPEIEFLDCYQIMPAVELSEIGLYSPALEVCVYEMTFAVNVLGFDIWYLAALVIGILCVRILFDLVRSLG